MDIISNGKLFECMFEPTSEPNPLRPSDQTDAPRSRHNISFGDQHHLLQNLLTHHGLSFAQLVFYGWSTLTTELLPQQCMTKVHYCYTLTTLTWASVWNATWHITCTQFKCFQVRQTVTVVHVASGVWSTFEWLSANPTWLTPLSRW